jgi:hypothetical protein
MTRIDSVGRSAAVAAAAAGVWIAWRVVAAPLFGVAAARAIYLVVVTALYAGALAASPPRRASTAVLVGAVGLASSAVAGDGPGLVLALATVLAVARASLLRRTTPARAVAIEAALVGGGLAFARFLATGAAQPTALALWGFFLVQSCAFLVEDGESPTYDGQHPDAFEEAYARATEALERGAV